MRFTFTCRSARMLPTVILAAARIQSSQYTPPVESSHRPVSWTVFIIAMMPPNLGTKPRKPATGLAAPW